jgi:homoserine dehydrogenase
MMGEGGEPPREPKIRVAFLGFGTVNRALHALLERRRDALAREHGITFVVTGVASRRTGWRAVARNADARGLDPERPDGIDHGDVHAWLGAARPDVVLEAIALDPHAGQPALDYLRAAIAHGAHAVSANKGPVVHGWRDLTRRATDAGRRYRFEAAVMDGAPVFSLVRECLPLAGLRAVRGVFTSTATVVLEAVEEGATIADGVARAQALGIAEADPAYDVDGLDSAVKLCAVANVLLGGDLRPGDVERRGIRTLREDDVRRARAENRPYRLVGEVAADAAGVLRARVAPERCGADHPLGAVRGTTLVTHLDADVFPGGLTVTSHDPDPTTTAYGMLADLVSVVRNR